MAALRERFAAGQLSQSTFVSRMEVALAARDRGELSGLFSDLGGPRGTARRPGAGSPPAGSGRRLLREAAAGPARRFPVAPQRPSAWTDISGR